MGLVLQNSPGSYTHSTFSMGCQTPFQVWWYTLWALHWWTLDSRWLVEHSGKADHCTCFVLWSLTFSQSKLPDGASPIFLIIYADKTRLSSFGTAKGYPVVARIANLPTEISNSDGAGGGRLVGWLPIVRTINETAWLISKVSWSFVGIRGLGWNWKKGICEFQTCCLASSILWDTWFDTAVTS